MESYLEWVRQFCLSLPHATEKVRWEHNLLFCISDKMFCVANLEPAVSTGRIAFKCTPEKFEELVEVEGLIPAPYMARNHWVSVRDMNALRRIEMEELIHNSYRLVLERLPKKTQAALAAAKPLSQRAKPPKRARPKPAAKRRK
jgi:predicted DNA-binding protein (MmcQ/YjbR family)